MTPTPAVTGPRTAEEYLRLALFGLAEEAVDTEYGRVVSEDAALAAIRAVLKEYRPAAEDPALDAYVEQMLDELAARFPGSTIRYVLRRESELHVVDLSGPRVVRCGPDEWADLYTRWVGEFEERFPREGLLLVRAGSLARVAPEEATKTR